MKDKKRKKHEQMIRILKEADGIIAVTVKDKEYLDVISMVQDTEDLEVMISGLVNQLMDWESQYFLEEINLCVQERIAELSDIKSKKSYKGS